MLHLNNMMANGFLNPRVEFCKITTADDHSHLRSDDSEAETGLGPLLNLTSFKVKYVSGQGSVSLF